MIFGFSYSRTTFCMGLEFSTPTSSGMEIEVLLFLLSTTFSDKEDEESTWRLWLVLQAGASEIYACPAHWLLPLSLDGGNLGAMVPEYKTFISVCTVLNQKTKNFLTSDGSRQRFVEPAMVRRSCDGPSTSTVRSFQCYIFWGKCDCQMRWSIGPTMVHWPWPLGPI